MADTYKAILVFRNAEGSNVTFTYKNANPNTESSDIQAAMNAIITNGDIFKRVPVTKKEAYLLKETRTNYNVGD